MDDLLRHVEKTDNAALLSASSDDDDDMEEEHEPTEENTLRALYTAEQSQAASVNKLLDDMAENPNVDHMLTMIAEVRRTGSLID